MCVPWVEKECPLSSSGKLPDTVSMTEVSLKFLWKLAQQYILGGGEGYGKKVKFRIIFPFTLRGCDSQLEAQLTLGEPVVLERSTVGHVGAHPVSPPQI